MPGRVFAQAGRQRQERAKGDRSDRPSWQMAWSQSPCRWRPRRKSRRGFFLGGQAGAAAGRCGKKEGRERRVVGAPILPKQDPT